MTLVDSLLRAFRSPAVDPEMVRRVDEVVRRTEEIALRTSEMRREREHDSALRSAIHRMAHPWDGVERRQHERRADCAGCPRLEMWGRERRQA